MLGIPDAGFFLDYPSNLTGRNDYGRNIQAVVELVNKNTPLPNAKCVADNQANPHYCLMAEHLVNYTTVPFFINQNLYDEWQIQNILQIGCALHQGWPIDMTKCSPDEMVEIHKFKGRMSTVLRDTFNADPKNRSIWGIACGVHCFADYGSVETSANAKKFTVP